jgi:hypothetical protein
MKFSKQFAFYRIPEFYAEYANYESVKADLRE